ncbi:MAG: hypothetical protein C0407_14945 [Desulfobacca sp.]|nr:hypothetical protein [Desulfobacca sp.]
MKKGFFLWPIALLFFLIPSISPAKELPKMAIWDLEAKEVTPAFAKDLTSILIKEIIKVEIYAVYTQENIQTITGWTEQEKILGCSNPQCLTALGQKDIAKLISGSVGKSGDRYVLTLSLFDAKKTITERTVSEFCQSDDQRIELVQISVKKLFKEQPEIVSPFKIIEKNPSTGPSSNVKEIARDSRFIAYADGTVLDTKTNLIWASKDNGSDIHWKKAKTYCEKYTGGGYTDWRMPTPVELTGLYDLHQQYQVTEASYIVHLTKLIQLSSNALWTSETRFSILGSSKVAAFHFGSGERFWVPQTYIDGYRVLPVRSGK